MIKKTRRILIVDDDADTLANLADILSDEGYEIVTACDGEIALREVSGCDAFGEAGQFDLCLLDFKMPGMDGVELLQKIRAEHPKLRAIMITAYAGDDGVQRALAAGTYKVMRKPVDIDSLLELIDEAIPR